MRSAPPAPPIPDPPVRLPSPDPVARFATPAPPEPRALDRLPPCWPIRCWALDRRCASESPRALPPNRSAVARSRYGVPPRCAGLCCQLLLLPPKFPPPAGSWDARFPRLPRLILVLRLKLLLLLI